MARVTVEDCVQKVPNRFELVLLAAQRARNLSRGEELTIDRDNDKNPVVALREIADETISRRATTGFLSLSRSIVSSSPRLMFRARCAASSTSSKRLGTFWTQSSTVTRAMRSASGME